MKDYYKRALQKDIQVVNSGGDGTREALAKAGASLVFEKTVDAIEWCRMHYIRTEPVPAAAPKL